MMNPSSIRAAIIGGSGYTGGELARLLLQHPHIEQLQIASTHAAGKYLHTVHPNLRTGAGSRGPMQFVAPEAIEACDVIFLTQSHGTSMHTIEQWLGRAPHVVDLSADFRLRDPAAYPVWYGHSHPHPELLSHAVYGIPELHREAIQGARLISGAGCLATASILGLFPLVQANILDIHAPIIIEAKVGSSAAGANVDAASHHADRSHAVRSYAPTGHRHTAEIVQELHLPAATRDANATSGVYFSATAIELVRGVLVTAQAFLREPLSEADIWRVYRNAYGAEPCIRIVKDRSGVYRYPEPKILAGSNFCDIGFAVEAHSRRIVVMAALDNLMKGAAGNAVQTLNVLLGIDETTGLTFTGLHPI